MYVNNAQDRTEEDAAVASGVAAPRVMRGGGTRPPPLPMTQSSNDHANDGDGSGMGATDPPNDDDTRLLLASLDREEARVGGDDDEVESVSRGNNMSSRFFYSYRPRPLSGSLQSVLYRPLSLFSSVSSCAMI